MTEPEKTRQQLWDERHSARDPIESPEPDSSLVRVASGWKPGRALDLAAGDGRNAIWLASRGWQATAVDFSAVALARAERSAAAAGVEIRLLQTDLLTWRPEPRSFDLVALVYLHLPPTERRAIYAAAADAVAPGGHLVVVGHDLSNLTDGVGGPQDPAVLFTTADIAAELGSDPGLAVVTAELVHRDGGAGRQMIDAVIVAERRSAEGQTQQ